ncbi:S46 family peptidase [Porphyromonas sp. oral taxon 278]|uniref:S46 family peptidase n=1 Tax=Porphyromonas sp. oral taxon 278 TaxID=712437 RepID=UPI0025E4E058|nr:S46 family peptidase [Porphyromonas sp. oral taxon 278]
MRKSLFALLVALGVSTLARADEGMWLLEQLSKKYPELVKRGLAMQEYDLYNPNGTSLKDAVVHFDGGCTGEVISSQGLVLTNHHCGYDAIQKLSSVEHNYLEDGYWAKSFAEELPAEGVVVSFVDKIEDVTAYVQAELKKIRKGTGMEYLSRHYLDGLARKRVGEAYLKAHPGTSVEIRPFYNGNKYLMFTNKVYSDIRFVGAPPSAVGKFGADTDNWKYPRHAGDISIFRIYADANGNPAPYSKSNVPLKPKRWFNISTDGVQKEDLAMIMGFPGRTNHFFLPSEVEEWKTIDNDIRIRMRQIRQEVMLKDMLADPKVNIMYAAKYARSQNAYKRAIGANFGIEKNNFKATKQQEMESLLEWSKANAPKSYRSYADAIATIDKAIAGRRDMRRQFWYLDEGLWQAIEATRAPGADDPLTATDRAFLAYNNKDYLPALDAKIAKAELAEYTRQIDRKDWPQAIADGIDQFGSVESYVDVMFAQSTFTTPEGFEAFKKLSPKEQQVVLTTDLMSRFAASVRTKREQLTRALRAFDNPIDLARRTYVGGILAQRGEENLWPDANSTLRFTFGNVRGYSPVDGVEYQVPTTLRGVMEKEDPTSWEFAVPGRLKEIYAKQLYGAGQRWAFKNASGGYEMPVNFVATTHTTGGNSGSPVFNKYGDLIGINFDRNWEGVGGDIQYLPSYQRSIICDIRYVLLLIDQLGECPRLIDELSLVSRR